MGLMFDGSQKIIFMLVFFVCKLKSRFKEGLFLNFCLQFRSEHLFLAPIPLKGGRFGQGDM